MGKSDRQRDSKPKQSAIHMCQSDCSLKYLPLELKWPNRDLIRFVKQVCCSFFLITASCDILSLPHLMYCFIHPRFWKNASNINYKSVITIPTGSKCALVKSYRSHWVCSDATNSYLRCVFRQGENNPCGAAFNSQC